MRRKLLSITAFFAMYACAFAQAPSAQTAPAPSTQPAPAVSAAPAPLTQWRSGLIELDEDWVEHDGDNLAWARPDFDSSTWKTVDLEDIGPAKVGWSWYRKHVVVGPDYPEVRLLLQGGGGVYELYVNGVRIQGAGIRSRFAARRPVEQVFTLDNDSGDFLIAIRTHVPASYAVYHFPLVMSITLGQRTVIGYERKALQSERLYLAPPSIGINLLLVFAGVAVLFLFASQRAHREYLYLGLYLLLVGVSDGIWISQYSGLLPDSVNLLFSDPLIYIFSVAQIEFTFAFAGRKLGRGWRAFEVILLCAPLLAYIDFIWHVLGGSYTLIEAALSAPVALLLPVMLWIWYRRGNREAGWLILPSLLPALSASLYNLGTASLFLGWRRLDFLTSTIPVGPLSLQTADLSSLLFLLAIGFVMFHRFTRVSREQAHAEAELEAAREVQRQLVRPAANTPGFVIESAYLPAAQVGGDFYHVRAYQDRSLLIAVGDVSGKGLPAALSVSAIVGALRALPELAPALMLEALNRGLSGNLQGGFVTCCVLRVAPDGSITFANAGHLSPYCNGREIELESGVPLGVIPGEEYAETHYRLNPGDKLTLLSDGIVEARNAAGELFGFERTRALSAESAEAIARAAQAFGQEDDITVLTLTFTAAPEPHPAPEALPAKTPA
jgi:sigma-B regulation protein RsbU (phosphoserine phosphatase)